MDEAPPWQEQHPSADIQTIPRLSCPVTSLGASTCETSHNKNRCAQHRPADMDIQRHDPSRSVINTCIYLCATETGSRKNSVVRQLTGWILESGYRKEKTLKQPSPFLFSSRGPSVSWHSRNSNRFRTLPPNILNTTPNQLYISLHDATTPEQFRKSPLFKGISWQMNSN